MSDPAAAAANLTAQLATMNEMLGVIAETSAGYKAKLTEAGFSEATAEQMTLPYHNALMTVAMSGLLSATKKR